MSKKRFTVRCPFHYEETPSCVADMKKNQYYCFGCEKTGTIEELLVAFKAVIPPIYPLELKIAMLRGDKNVITEELNHLKKGNIHAPKGQK